MSVAAPRPVTEVPRSVPVGVARKTLESVRRLRSNFVFGTLLALFAGLLGRLAYLQLVHGADYRALAAQLDSETVKATRGEITDRHGRVLAFSRPARLVALDPGKTSTGEWVIADPARFAMSLADILDDGDALASARPDGWKPAKSAFEIRKAIQAAREAGPGHWVPIAQNIEDPRVIARLDEAKGDLRGLIVRTTERRAYANKEWAAHVLGRAVYGTHLVNGEPVFDMEGPLAGGEMGIEAAFDRELKGAAGTRQVKNYGHGRSFATKPGADDGERDGLDVQLTLDIVVQHACEAALDRLVKAWSPKGAVAIVLDPQTGDVLALACRPGFDPNREAPTTNLAIQGRYEPGSTFKPFTATAALALGVVTPSERIPMPAARTFEFAGGKTRTIHDHAPIGEADGCGDLYRLLSQSSNVGAAELGLRIAKWGIEAKNVNGMKMLFDALALHEPTGVGLPMETYSRAPERWTLQSESLSMGFGQNIALTPMRLISLFAAFAREDFSPVAPRIVLRVGDEVRPVRASAPSLLGDKALEDVIRQALAGVVEEGTGAETFKHARYSIAGKTGTAKNEQLQTYVSSFVGFAPRESPRIVVLVLADRPDATHAKPYGAVVAGPAVKDIVEETLDYFGLPAKQEAGR